MEKFDLVAQFYGYFDELAGDLRLVLICISTLTRIDLSVCKCPTFRG